MPFASGVRPGEVQPLVGFTLGAHSRTQGRRLAGVLLALCVAAQFIILAALSARRVRIFAAAIAVAAAVWSYRAWVRGSGSPLREMLLATAALGGLGMLIGSAMDQGILRPAFLDSSDIAVGHFHEGLVNSDRNSNSWQWAALGHISSWMSFGMLLFCVPPCAFVCLRCTRTGRWRVWFRLTACTAGMLAGMCLGEAFVSRLFPAMAASIWLVQHLGMVIGMVAGTGATFTFVAGES